MEITDVRIRLLKDTSDRLKAFCTVTFDDEFVVRDIKIVDGTSGLFIAMPSKKVTFTCPTCRHRNQLRAKFCEECGQRLEEPSMGDGDGRDKLHRDMAHPITTEFRAKLQDRIIEAFNQEFANASDPDYQKSEDESEEVVEAGPPKSDYNEMIAGLKSGGGGGRGERNDKEQGDARRGGGGRNSRNDKPRANQENRAKPRREEPRRENKPVAEKAEATKPREEKPAAPKRRTTKPVVNEDVDSGGFGAGLDVETEIEAAKPRDDKPASPKRRKTKPVVEEVAVVNEDVESSGFGDGLDVATEVESTVASVDPNEDSTAFGSGIL